MLLNIFDRFTTGTDLTMPGYIIITVLGANIGLRVFNRYFGHIVREENNTVAGIFFATISVLYSLILAFVIMAEWDDYNSLDKTIATESDKLNSIVAHSGRLPDSLKSTVASSLSVYCRQVIKKEWQMSRNEGIEHPSAIPALRQMLLTSEPTNKLEENVLQIMDEDLSAISDLRRERLSHTRSQLPPLVWLILEAGAVLLTFFTYFFKTGSAALQKIYLSIFVCLLAMCLCIVHNLDQPFAANSGVDSAPYQRLLLELPNYYVSDLR